MAPLAGRFSARLQSLPHGALVEIAALGCVEGAATRRLADALAARHSPLCESAVDLLLSPDLLRHVFAPLVARDAAAAAVCAVWRRTWVDTRKERRVLHLGPPPPVPDFEWNVHFPAMAARGERLFVAQRKEVRLVDMQMRTLHTITVAHKVTGLCLDDTGGLHVATSRPARLLRYTVDELAPLPTVAGAHHSRQELSGFEEPNAVGQVLYALAYCDHDQIYSEVHAFDVATLTPRDELAIAPAQFEASLAYGMAVVGEEVFLGSQADRGVHVFALHGGQPLRRIEGAFQTPWMLRVVGDRLCVGSVDNVASVQKTRVHVLSVACGRALQVWTPPARPDGGVWDYPPSLAPHGDALLVRLSYVPGLRDAPLHHVFALHGI